MQVYNFSILVKSFLKLFILFIFTSCGTYQYSGNMNDDVYGESTPNVVENTVENLLKIHKTYIFKTHLVKDLNNTKRVKKVMYYLPMQNSIQK